MMGFINYHNGKYILWQVPPGGGSVLRGRIELLRICDDDVVLGVVQAGKFTGSLHYLCRVESIMDFGISDDTSFSQETLIAIGRFQIFLKLIKDYSARSNDQYWPLEIERYFTPLDGIPKLVRKACYYTGFA